jgi:UDP-N-acetylglucosamine 1-carboxyvinyltransferase
MQVMKIRGGKPLNGTIEAGGAKNAITKMLVASLLSDKRCTFYNVPNISEVDITLQLCSEIGMQYEWNKKEKTLSVITKHLSSTYVPQRFSGANRIPILMIGALLGRTDEDIVVPTVGGCKIGKRPVDFHVKALEALGATIEFREMKKDGAYFAHAHKGLKGCLIELPYPSVGATENTILAAARAKGTTVIKNAALEPEILDLILFLQKLGIIIQVDINKTIIIEGTDQFYEVEHKVISDRIEVASYAMAALSSKGRIFVKGASQIDLMTFLKPYRQLGGGFTAHADGIEFFYHSPLKGGLVIETDVHPGFLTDWQQPFVVLLTQCEGSSVIHETVYENRFGYTETLKEMGAHISLFHQCLGEKCCRFTGKNFLHSLVVSGPTPLNGKEISIPDLRAGFAYVLAALIAKTETTLSNLHYLERGYDNLYEKLLSLGADIELVEVKGPLSLEDIIPTEQPLSV